MFDKDNNIIYVGKAKNLKKRVSQYFLRPQVGKTAAMVSHVDHFETILTDTEKEALICDKIFDSSDGRVKAQKIGENFAEI